MSMLLLTSAQSYAYDARGYGLVLGYFSLAVVCWQQLGERGRRILPLIGLALGLSGAVASHYYAALLLPSVAIGEVLRSRRQGRVAWDVWLATAAPVFVLASAWPLLSAARTYSGTFWAAATWTGMHTFYVWMFASGISGIGAGLAAAFLCQALFSSEPQPYTPARIPMEEIVLAVAVAAAPFAGVLFGKTITGAFTPRYAIGGAIGLSILFGFVAFTVFRGSGVCAAAFVVVVTAVFCAQNVVRIAYLRTERQGFQEMLRMLPAGSPDSPLVIAQSDLFYKLTFYTPPELKRNYIYLTDEKRSARFLGQDTPDRSLSALAPWFGLPVRSYESHVASHPAMTVLTDLDPKWTWLPDALVEDGRATVQVVRRFGSEMLLSVQRNP
jgi:hypothetical protein